MSGPQIDILTPEYEADPNPILDDNRENHPIYFHEGLDSWVLSRHDDILEALRTTAFTTNNYAWQLAPVHGKNILQLEGLVLFDALGRELDLTNELFQTKLV